VKEHHLVNHLNNFANWLAQGLAHPMVWKEVTVADIRAVDDPELQGAYLSARSIVLDQADLSHNDRHGSSTITCLPGSPSSRRLHAWRRKEREAQSTSTCLGNDVPG